MTSKQIHELLPAATLTAEDRIVVSTASGNLTRRATIASLATRLPDAGAVDRRISEKLSEAVSVRDFGAVGDGVADDAPAFEAALGAHLAVHVPAGSYRLASTIMVKPGRTITGAGREATVLVAEGPLALAFQRNAGAYAIDTSSADDWCRSSCAASRSG
ncbi:MAG: glycosyl hydrolase family 28-related protein [Geminicoccaceae bacterium]